MPSSYDPDIHHRRSIRLRHYDYRQSGAYYLTFCTYNRLCIFGQIINNQMVLNKIGQIAATEWERTPQIRAEIEHLIEVTGELTLAEGKQGAKLVMLNDPKNFA